MSLYDLGVLAKLKIKANTEVFEVMFNPESYTETFSIAYKLKNDLSSNKEEVYVKTMPQEFSLKLIFDGTGVADFHIPYLPVISNQDQSVYKKVNQFLRLTWYCDNGKPNPLEIKWGEFLFYCRLKNVNIQYTLFSREGLPLRAELDATFISYNEEKNKQYEKRFQAKPVPAAASGNQPVVSAQPNQPVSGDNMQNGIKIKVS